MVLTVEPGGYYAFDESLLQEVQEAGVEIVRASSLDANRLFKRTGVVSLPRESVRKLLSFLGDTFFIPDTKIGWRKRALAAAVHLCARQQFHAVIATAPPQTDFIVGADLKKKTGIPLLLDYRDAWLEYPFKYYPTPIHTWLHKRLERKVLRAADRVVVTHRRVKESLVKRHRTLHYNDVTIVSQGFDAEDFTVEPEHRPPGSPMRVVHAGTFYGHRSPDVLIRAVHRLVTADPGLRKRIEVRLIGAKRRQDGKLVTKLGVSDVVLFDGYLEHRACIRTLKSADVLWYVNDNDTQSPGKLYEYFAAGAPIMASVVEGYTKQQILESQAAFCVPLLDVAAHETTLLHLLKLHDAGTLPRVSSEFAERFERLKLTGELARQLESMMDFDRGEIIRVQENAR